MTGKAAIITGASDLGASPRDPPALPVGVAPAPTPGGPFTSAACQCDGYYEATLTPGRSWILYRDDVPIERVRFTLLHELAHHPHPRPGRVRGAPAGRGRR